MPYERRRWSLRNHLLSTNRQRGLATSTVNCPAIIFIHSFICYKKPHNKRVCTIAADQWINQFRCFVNRGTVGVNSLPKTVTRRRCGCDLNPGPSASESSTLTTRLQSQPHMNKNNKKAFPWLCKRKCGFFPQHHGNTVNCRCNHNFVCLA